MISIDDLKTLIRLTGEPKISLYLPTHHAVPEVQQDPIRLKKRLREAEDALEAKGWSKSRIDGLLGEARALLDDRAFWENQDHGLVLFIDEDETRILKLPIEVKSRTVVNDRFYVRPLVPLFMRDGRFAVLVVAQDHAQLCMADRNTMAPVKVRDMPSSVEVFLGPKEIDNAVDYHAGDANMTSRGPALMHSALGESPGDAKAVEVERYANAVGKAAAQHLSGSHVPLVIAADDRMLGMVRAQIDYPDLVEDGIRQNPHSLKREQLHEKAYALVRDRLDASRRAVMEQVEARLKSGEPASSDVVEIIEAAHYGRVESLLIVPGTVLRGEISANGADQIEVTVKGDDEDGRDLVDFAVAETLANGGAVYSLPADAVADGGGSEPVRAVFRY